MDRIRCINDLMSVKKDKLRRSKHSDIDKKVKAHILKEMKLNWNTGLDK